MRIASTLPVLAAALLVSLLASPAAAEPAAWHPNLKDGLEASARSGKPVLLVTGWKPKV